jgi:uncharacterized protein (DUF1330 family)
MAQVIVRHHVEDYERWFPVFEEHGDVRRSHGGTGHTVYRGAMDPNDLTVVNDFATLEGARQFLDDPSLKEVMGRAGVDSDPEVWICDQADSARY